MPESPDADLALLEAALDQRRQRVEAALRGLHDAGRAPRVAAAIEQCLFAPAKRLRPILALVVAEVLRGDPEAVLPAACAVEMVHTASVILDDLPCMDDGTLRRGRSSCHVVHGEATAILAAFALLNRAFEVLAVGWPAGPDAAGRAEIAAELARAIGLAGMIAGQAADLAPGDGANGSEAVRFVHSCKTGALFTASAAIGALSVQASADERAVVVDYATSLGLAFQIVDDVIDVTGCTATAGKDVGKDADKANFVSLSGIGGAQDLARQLVASAQGTVARFGPRARPLLDLARYVVTRRR
jgi:geranylgeranyl diphosphate synthase type II